ncbi:CPW-WPC family protein, putative [Hepatocystis sp. ex Piliocolobus tephrosceles]|nr:CPW-WPC family protein, putative [Hepatocystis sp. ex Piliocolobus tephrosceles]
MYIYTHKKKKKRTINRTPICQHRPYCNKDYSHNCANGWTKSNLTEECIAPISYRGPCPRFLQAETETKKKKILEQECNIFWPCIVDCEKDYTVPCPEKWVQEDEENCRPLSTYDGTCLSKHNFTNMTNEQKNIWSNKCLTSWPCKENCKKDYSKECPQGWIKENDGTCYAPKKYSGPCLSRVSLSSLDKDMKVAFEKLCMLQYPCLKTCEIDDNDPCPKNWIVKSDALGTPISCLPPDNYIGQCGEYTKFVGLNAKSKESVAHDCDITWPCVREAANIINYEELCPEDWIKSDKYCLAPQHYMGPCSRKKLFNLFKKELKMAYAEECNVQWPLIKNNVPHYPKMSALRKGKTKFGSVEPITGDVISNIVEYKKIK